MKKKEKKKDEMKQKTFEGQSKNIETDANLSKKAVFLGPETGPETYERTIIWSPCITRGTGTCRTVQVIFIVLGSNI